VDEGGAREGDVVEGAGDGDEFGALVGLAVAAEGLGNVSGVLLVLRDTERAAYLPRIVGAKVHADTANSANFAVA
jgi:hypothetical protein